MIANLSDAMAELGRTAAENEQLRERVKDLACQRNRALERALALLRKQVDFHEPTWHCGLCGCEICILLREVDGKQP